MVFGRLGLGVVSSLLVAGGVLSSVGVANAVDVVSVDKPGLRISVDNSMEYSGQLQDMIVKREVLLKSSVNSDSRVEFAGIYKMVQGGSEKVSDELHLEFSSERIEEAEGSYFSKYCQVGNSDNCAQSDPVTIRAGVFNAGDYHEMVGSEGRVMPDLNTGNTWVKDRVLHVYKPQDKYGMIGGVRLPLLRSSGQSSVVSFSSDGEGYKVSRDTDTGSERLYVLGSCEKSYESYDGVFYKTGFDDSVNSSCLSLDRVDFSGVYGVDRIVFVDPPVPQVRRDGKTLIGEYSHPGYVFKSFKKYDSPVSDAGTGELVTGDQVSGTGFYSAQFCTGDGASCVESNRVYVSVIESTLVRSLPNVSVQGVSFVEGDPIRQEGLIALGLPDLPEDAQAVIVQQIPSAVGVHEVEVIVSFKGGGVKKFKIPLEILSKPEPGAGIPDHGLQPTVVDKGVGTDSPELVDKGVGTDSPAVVDKGVGTDSPVTVDRGVGTDSPVTVDKGVGTDSPAVVDKGVGTDSPAVVDKGVGTDSPAVVDKGVGTDTDVLVKDSKNDVPVDGSEAVKIASSEPAAEDPGSQAQAVGKAKGSGKLAVTGANLNILLLPIAALGAGLVLCAVRRVNG